MEDSWDRPIIWVSGPPGCGKTTLVASYLDARKLPCLWYQVDEGDADISTFFYYLGLAAKKAAPRNRKPLPLLTPEYMLGIPTFTLRYFESLFSRLNPPTPPFSKGGNKGGVILVFDNYHQAPAESKLHEIMSHGLEIVPEKINVIVISRSEPPSQFVRLRANNKLSFLGWNEIRFTIDEIKKFIYLKTQKNLADDISQQAHKKTGGWIAGLVLLLEMAKIKSIDYYLLDKFLPEEIFHYFAREIFEKIDQETQDFLLKTAFLPTMTSQMTEKLTGISKSGQILSDLNQSNFFTDKISYTEPFYQYHPLFREFLLAHAKDSFDHNQITFIQRSAAILLEESEKIENASRLYIDAKDWDGLVRLILNNAQSLMVQGRTEILREWIMSIPEEMLKRMPWLLYWLGVCKMSFNLSESRRDFEQAFRLFNEQGDSVGIYLSWAAIVDTILHQWDDFTQLDNWIEWLDHRVNLDLSFPSPEVESYVASSMVGALQWRKPQHRDIEKWVERALSLSKELEDINTFLKTGVYALTHFVWNGNIRNSLIVVDEMKRKALTPSASPLNLITLKMAEEAIYTLNAMTYEKSHQAVLEGVEISRKSGVHIIDNMLYSHGVYGCLCLGDMVRAGEFLQKTRAILDDKRRNFVSHYHFLTAWYNLLLNNVSTASTHAEEALKLAIETGTPFPELMIRLIMAQVLHKKEEYQKASNQLDIVKGLGLESPFFKYICFLTEAQFDMDKGKENACLESLRKAMALGKEQEYFTAVFFWLPSVMARLCVKALQNGIEADYVQELIRKLDLFPHAQPLEIETWPWPLRIHTFGKIELLKDGKPVQFSVKVQKKPLLMLKALIALGGTKVREDKLEDILWPDAEGDAAHNAFATTLARLRNLLGTEKAIELQEGKVSLNPHYCWVDTWAFEKLLDQVEALWGKSRSGDNMPEALRLAEKAISLYKGHFLADEEEQLWTVSLRELLKSKFIHLVGRLGHFYEQAGQWGKAVGYYQRSLEVDYLTEEFYQRLMICYQRLGRRSDAIASYQRCRKILSVVLGIEPSAETEELYKNIKAQSKSEKQKLNLKDETVFDSSLWDVD